MKRSALILLLCLPSAYSDQFKEAIGLNLVDGTSNTLGQLELSVQRNEPV
ncbi:uncharacterized protein METZ01_LOCUS499264, partial [marine metagenome]